MRAAEADKTEHELAGAVRRLRFEQQGTQLDCAICLRKVPPQLARLSACGWAAVAHQLQLHRAKGARRQGLPHLAT